MNSDVVMILHLDPNKKTASILSIPRDLFVPNARATGANKIDAALVEGPEQLVSAIEEDFGIPIHHYVELNFDSFQGVVNALGGIKMYFPEPVFDAYSGLNVPTAGCRSSTASRRSRWSGPGTCVQGPRRHDQQPRRLAPGPPERPEQDPAGPRIPAGPRHRGGQAGTREPRHRQRPARRGGPAAPGRLGLLARSMFGLVTHVPRHQHPARRPSRRCR